MVRTHPICVVVIKAVENRVGMPHGISIIVNTFVIIKNATYFLFKVNLLNNLKRPFINLYLCSSKFSCWEKIDIQMF